MFDLKYNTFYQAFDRLNIIYKFKKKIMVLNLKVRVHLF